MIITPGADVILSGNLDEARELLALLHNMSQGIEDVLARERASRGDDAVDDDVILADLGENASKLRLQLLQPLQGAVARRERDRLWEMAP